MKDEMKFRQWLADQVGRFDRVGVLARSAAAGGVSWSAPDRDPAWVRSSLFAARLEWRGTLARATMPALSSAKSRRSAGRRMGQMVDRRQRAAATCPHCGYAGCDLTLNRDGKREHLHSRCLDEMRGRRPRVASAGQRVMRTAVQDPV